MENQKIAKIKERFRKILGELGVSEDELIKILEGRRKTEIKKRIISK